MKCVLITVYYKRPSELLIAGLFFICLVSGCSFHDLHFSYRIGISIASKIVSAVCLSIWSTMRPECVPRPTKEQWELTALQSERTANFPHCLGTVDGKYIQVINPENSGSIFCNYNIFSLWY